MDLYQFLDRYPQAIACESLGFPYRPLGTDDAPITRSWRIAPPPDRKKWT